jgi:hypothetical protein
MHKDFATFIQLVTFKPSLILPAGISTSHSQSPRLTTRDPVTVAKLEIVKQPELL